MDTKVSSALCTPKREGWGEIIGKRPVNPGDMIKACVAATVIAILPGFASAAEPHVVWRSGDSGVLATPVSTPSIPADPGGGGAADVILEAPQDFYFYMSLGSQTMGVNMVGGSEPYTFSMSGSLPAGLMFMPNSNGSGGSQAVIFGVPTQIDSAGKNVTITGTDSTGKSASRTVKIASFADHLALEGPTRPRATTGNPTSWSYTVENAIGPVTYRVYSRLPAGMSLDTATGIIQGVVSPGEEGTYKFTIQATDSIGQTSMLSIEATVES